MDSPQRLQQITSVVVAKYAHAHGIAKEATFVCWALFTLRKRDITPFVVKSHIRKITHKYGIEIPSSIEHAHKIDQKNGYFGEMQSY